jgi:hypothetical protein
MLVINSEGEMGIIMLGTPEGDVIAGSGDLNGDQMWKPLSRRIQEDLTGDLHTSSIVKVYSYSSNKFGCSFDLSERKLLWEREESIEIKLTSDYDAKINFTKKVITVGCQTIPFSKIEEIHGIIKDSTK